MLTAPTDGGANVSNGVKRGATEILDTNAAGRRGRPLVELSREAWEKAKAAIAWGSFFLDEDATREELLAYRIFALLAV
jgi:hypothetical protein